MRHLFWLSNDAWAAIEHPIFRTANLASREEITVG